MKKLNFSWIRAVKTIRAEYFVILFAALVLLGGAGVATLRNSNSNNNKATDSSLKGKEQTSPHSGAGAQDQPVQAPSGSSELIADGPTSVPATVPDTTGATQPKDATKKSAPKMSTPGASTPADEADTTPPSTPTNLVVYNDPNHDFYKILDWDASTDNVGVTGYYIYRLYFYYPGNPTDHHIHDVDDGSTDDTDTYPMCGRGGPHHNETYYAVKAHDAAGNVSDPIFTSILDEPGKNCYDWGV